MKVAFIRAAFSRDIDLVGFTSLKDDLDGVSDLVRVNALVKIADFEAAVTVLDGVADLTGVAGLRRISAFDGVVAMMEVFSVKGDALVGVVTWV